MAAGQGPGEGPGDPAALAAVADPGNGDQPAAAGDRQRGRGGSRLGDQPVDVLAQRPGRVHPGRVLGQHDQMRPGQPQPEPLTADQQVGGITAGQEVVDELQALGLLAAGDGQVRPLEAFGRGRDRVVGGPQYPEPGRPQIGQAGHFPPQPPGRGQVQVNKAPQGHTTLRGLLPRAAVPGEFHGGQAAAGAGRVRRRGKVPGQQVRGHTARFAARRAGDRGQVNNVLQGLTGPACPAGQHRSCLPR